MPIPTGLSPGALTADPISSAVRGALNAWYSPSRLAQNVKGVSMLEALPELSQRKAVHAIQSMRGMETPAEIFKQQLRVDRPIPLTTRGVIPKLLASPLGKVAKLTSPLGAALSVADPTEMGAGDVAMPGSTYDPALGSESPYIGELPFILNPEDALLPEQPAPKGLYGPESLGENITDRTSQLSELASGVGTTDPNVMSQSAQTLIKSFTDDPAVASLVSRKVSMRDAVGEALDRYLPAAFGIRSAHAISTKIDTSTQEGYERARTVQEIENELIQEDKDSEVRKLLDKAKEQILGEMDFKPRYRGMRPVRQPSALDQLMDTEMLELPGPSWVDEAERVSAEMRAAEADREAAAGVETFEDIKGPGWFSRMMSSIIPEVEASVSRDPGYERTVTEPTWFPPTTSSGSAMAETAGDRNYLSDIEKWRIQNEEKQDLSVEDMQAHDVRDHIDLVYGVRMESPYAHTDTIRKTLSAAGKILPDFMRDAYLTSSMGDSLEGIQNLVEDHTKGESLVTPSHIFPRIDLGDWSRGDPVPKDEAQEDIRHMLKDVVNNTLFTAARDAEISPMEIYENDNVVFDEGKFDVLAEALLDEKAHVDQLGAALELVRDAPEDERVVESFTEQGLIDIASQVESFANIPAAPWTPQAPVIPDIVVPPPAVAPPPPVDDFSSMFPSPAPEPQVEDFSAIRDRAAEKAAERDREAEAASAKRGREAEAAAAERSRAAEAAAEQRKEAAKQRVRDKKAAAKREAADKRAADRAAAKSARMSAAQKRNIAKVAKASRKAEAKREAATKKRAEEQRRKDKEAQRIFAEHKKWAAENAKKLREREANRLKQMGYKKPVTGSQFIYT